MDLATAGLFGLGFVLLVAGASALVSGAARLAAAAGVSPLVVGLTVVAYGTSAPEMAVSVKAALQGQAGIVLGNVVGSNILNVLLVLGGSALISPLVVSRQLVRLDVPIMIGLSLVLFGMAQGGRIEVLHGAALLALAAAYTVFTVRRGKREPAAVLAALEGRYAGRRGSIVANLALAAVGVGLLVLGARFLVDASLAFARAFGVSELVIGLTVVALGTSLPEAATSLLAAARGEREIAVGNVVGSNIFNIVAVLGASALVADGGVPVPPAAMRLDIPVMVAVAVACLPIFATGHVVARWEGALFLGYYAAYTLYLALDAQGHDALPAFSGAMIGFVLPLTVVTLGVVAWRSLRRA